MADEPSTPKRPRKSSGARPHARRGAREQVTPEDRAKAAEQIGNVVPIKRPPGNPKKAAGRNGGATSAASLATWERRQHALRMRRLGYTYAEVAHDVQSRFNQPKYTASDASHDVRSVIDSVTVEAVQGLREEDLAILAALQRSVMLQAQRGDLRAVRTMLDILERRAKYLGLDAPVKHELTGAGGGPLEVDTSDPGAVFAAAVGALDALLPMPEPPELPGR